MSEEPDKTLTRGEAKVLDASCTQAYLMASPNVNPWGQRTLRYKFALSTDLPRFNIPKSLKFFPVVALISEFSNFFATCILLTYQRTGALVLIFDSVVLHTFEILNQNLYLKFLHSILLEKAPKRLSSLFRT